MNKDQLKGRVKEATGKVQKNVADAMDNESEELKGANRETEGKIQKNLGDIKNKIGNAIDR
jgi:uncharacterized protein YjbJ (UPF0337 family)